MKSNHLFILGNPRSGTSLLRLVLTLHSCISIPPESNFFLGLEERYSDGVSLKEVNSFLKELFNFRKFIDLGLTQQDISHELQKRDFWKYSEVIREIHKAYAKHTNKPDAFFFGDKNRIWPTKINLIKAHFPDAKIVHIIRDPRDIIVSYKDLNKQKPNSSHYPNLPTSIDAIMDDWVFANNSIEAEKKYLDSVTVFYESLVEEMETSVGEIFESLGLMFEKKVLSYYNEDIFGNLEPQSHQAWKSLLKSPPAISNIGKFKSSLDIHDIKHINIKYQKQLTRYGYL